MPTLGLVLRTPVYRRATLSLFFAGLGISVAMPQLSLFLVQDLHASLPVAGLFFLTNLAAPILGFLVGRWSDRLADRLLLFRVGAVVGLLGWVLLAFSTQVWMAFVINATVLGFAGATGSLIFAAVRDQLTHVPTGADNRVMSTVRLGFSAGFMAGPLIGSVLGGMVGLRTTLVVAGVCTVLQVVPMIGQQVLRAEPRRTAEVGAAGPAQPPSLRPLLVFLGHLEWAGIDAADMLTRYQERLVDLHLKDLDLAVAQHSRENPTSYSATMNGGLFAEPGLGTLDLDRILGALDTFTGWVIIEVDKATMDPFQSALHTGGWLRETIPA